MREPFEIGKVLARTFAVLLSNLLPFMILSGVVLSPIIISTFYVYLRASTEAQAVFGVAVILLAMLLTPVATAAITFGVFQQLSGKPSSLGACLRMGLTLLIPVFGVVVLSALAVMGACLPGIAMIVTLAVAPIPDILRLAVAPAMMFVFVPAAVIVCMLYVAVPSCVVERPGVIGALRRSRELTRGYRWPIFGVFFLLTAMNVLLVGIIELGFAGTGVLYHSLSSLLNVVITSLNATAAALVYHRLRSLKEIFDAEEIAAVFA